MLSGNNWVILFIGSDYGCVVDGVDVAAADGDSVDAGVVGVTVGATEGAGNAGADADVDEDADADADVDADVDADEDVDADDAAGADLELARAAIFCLTHPLTACFVKSAIWLMRDWGKADQVPTRFF